MTRFLCLLILLFAASAPTTAQEVTLEVTPDVTEDSFPPEDWIEVGSDGFALLGDAERTRAIYGAVQPIYERMAAMTRSQSAIRLLLVTDGLLPGCVLNDEGEAVVEAMDEPCTPENVELSGYQPLIVPDGARAEEVLTQALFERFFSTGRLPAWFVSGMVDFYAPTPKPDWLSLTRDAARANRLFTVAQLEAQLGGQLGDPFTARLSARADSDEFAARVQAHALVLYLIDRVGIGGLLVLAQADDFSSTYARLVGQPFTASVSNLPNWVFTRAAETAYLTDHFAAPTPMPTASPPPTATPTLAPTDTPTTPTPTPTLTAAAAATLTPGRAPTLTASWTPTRQPATITPRPPGSPLIAQPAPPETPALPTAFALPQINIVTLLIVLLVILILVYVALSYRQ